MQSKFTICDHIINNSILFSVYYHRISADAMFLHHRSKHYQHRETSGNN